MGSQIKNSGSGPLGLAAGPLAGFVLAGGVTGRGLTAAFVATAGGAFPGGSPVLLQPPGGNAESSGDEADWEQPAVARTQHEAAAGPGGSSRGGGGGGGER